MGNFEKVVVLLILLVCVVVLSISLRSPEVDAPQNRKGAQTVSGLGTEPVREILADRQSPAPSVRDHSADKSASANLRDSIGTLEETDREIAVNEPEISKAATPVLDPLLSSLVRTGGGRQVALVSTKALKKTVSPDFMIYTCRKGDNWRSLSERFYGDVDHAQLLLTANEEVESPEVNDLILVPVYELDIRNEPREPAKPRDEVVGPVESSYSVQSGDTLSTISTKMYGTGSRWMQIYDANRNILDDPHALKVGQKLLIP